ncbi:GNAT family N-acetyltransferase [Bacillus cereus]|uniref:GNAT family N-acetyltransferase n=1 Tax=Bacillus cereus TaxID=1396 RepID=UPI000BF7A266|nr:GNAT family N-acetyltransferase [Bacillus cereus]PFD48735.1 GNAT family N-acetyltransferase [Bacillus cereus]PFH95736.1 GNAT family N-acetyltransferase [Bacillus cereus]
MRLIIEKLSQENAEEIANNWKYPDQYSFYNMTEDPEDYEEITTPELRADNYFQVLNNNELFGFFALYSTESVIEMGIGIKPELTGKGLGEEFIRTIIEFIKDNYSISTIRLSVVDFNIRAQKVYSRQGFSKTREYSHNTNNSVYKFIEMEHYL